MARASLESESMIVCGYDGSPLALGALEVAYGLSRKLGTGLRIVRALDVLGIEYDVELHARCEAELEEVLRSFGGDLPAEIKITSGLPADDVLNAATAGGAQLVVIGAHGHGHGDLASRIGSTTDAIVARSEVPVLVVRHPQPLLDAIVSRSPLHTLVAVAPGRSTAALSWTQRLLAAIVGDVRGLSVLHDHHAEETALADGVEVVRDQRPVAAVVSEQAAREHIGLVAVGRAPKRHLLARSQARAIVRESTTNVVCVPDSLASMPST